MAPAGISSRCGGIAALGTSFRSTTSTHVAAIGALLCADGRDVAISCLAAGAVCQLIAYGGGWTALERQQAVGDTGRHEPRHADAIIEAELQRSLADPDPLRGIAQLTARWAAAFVLDPVGVPRTKALGTERLARKLRDALPGGETALRAAVWELMRPMLSPALVELNRDAFVADQGVESTVDLHALHAACDLDDLVLGEEPDTEAV